MSQYSYEYRMTQVLSSCSSPVASYDSDLISTGYLEDVLFQFSSNSKRRRLLDDCTPQFDSSSMKETSDLGEITKCDINYSNTKTHEEAISESYYAGNYQCTPEKENLYGIDNIPTFSFGDDEEEKSEKRLLAKVVYPFALVKPGGFEGGTTLNDINERILMPPTRPVRHPVGEFACRPLVSRDGPGLSGKVVVAFTRIQTQGRGTITIVRTRG